MFSTREIFVIILLRKPAKVKSWKKEALRKPAWPSFGKRKLCVNLQTLKYEKNSLCVNPQRLFFQKGERCVNTQGYFFKASNYLHSIQVLSSVTCVLLVINPPDANLLTLF